MSPASPARQESQARPVGTALDYTWAITTSAAAGGDHIEEARGIAERWRVPFIHRGGQSLPELRARHNIDYIVTLDRNSLLSVDSPPLRWHPSMALTRLRSISTGLADGFLTASGLCTGDRFLDCTLGFGADAIIASWAVGEGGMVTGLESSPIIALLTEYGLKREAPGFDSRRRPIAAAAGRIRVVNARAADFLSAQADASWDIVYFDPMFKAANLKSSGMNALRPFADDAPFGRETLTEALRVCAKRVMLKERRFSPIFTRLEADRIIKTKYSPVSYGAWERR